MLKATLLMFSRTLTKDYRWIYLDSCLDPDEKECMLHDYRNFENNKEYYLNEQHLIIREFRKSIVAYQFCDTENIDQNSRNILAMTGYIFSGIDFEIAQDLLKYIAPFLFVESNAFGSHYHSVTDATDNIKNQIDFNLDSIFDKYKKCKYIRFLANHISTFLKDHSDNSFIITRQGIKPLNHATLHPFQTSEHPHEIINSLSNTDSSSLHSSVSHPKRLTQERSQSPLDLLRAVLQSKKSKTS